MYTFIFNNKLTTIKKYGLRKCNTHVVVLKNGFCIYASFTKNTKGKKIGKYYLQQTF